MTPIEQFWQKYISTLPADHRLPAAPLPDAFAFGDHPALADELGGLVLRGIKTATCGSPWEYEADGQPLPVVGAPSIVLDGRGNPLCVFETSEVTIRRFDEVDAQFAYEEGEGDRSLEAWRAGHRTYFWRVLPAIGRTVRDDMPLVCERFRLLYPRPVTGDFTVYAGYRQFYVRDAAALGDTGADDFWTTEAAARQLALNPGILGIGTRSYGEVPVTVAVLDSEPPSMPGPWDRIHHAELTLRSDQLIIMGCPDHAAGQLTIPPGTYRACIYYGGQQTPARAFEQHDDFYRIELWQEEGTSD